MEINWYPGHMAKARRLLADQLRRVDVVLELCDARLPDSSRNPELEKLTAGKKRVLLQVFFLSFKQKHGRQRVPGERKTEVIMIHFSVPFRLFRVPERSDPK